MSSVTDYPAAASDVAIAHFSARLSVETDCADVASAFRSGDVDFVCCMWLGRRKLTRGGTCRAQST